jgi:hypothetical protein
VVSEGADPALTLATGLKDDVVVTIVTSSSMSIRDFFLPWKILVDTPVVNEVAALPIGDSWGNQYDATNSPHSLKHYSLDVSRVAIKSVGYAARRIGICL